MEFFLVLKALVWIHLISYSCAEEVQKAGEETVKTEGQNQVYYGTGDMLMLTAYLTGPNSLIFNQRVENPEFKGKAACFELEEEAANSLNLRPVQFVGLSIDNHGGSSEAKHFCLLYTKIFSCLTDSLYAFLHVQRAYEVLSPVKQINYDPNVLSIVKKKKRWNAARKLFCMSSEEKEKLYVEEISFRNQADINTVIRLNDGVHITFYDKEFMKKEKFWPGPEK